MLNIIVATAICLILYPYVSTGADVFLQDMAFILKVAIYYLALAYIKIVKYFKRK